MNIENMTPHVVTVMDENGEIILVPRPSGNEIRCKAATVRTGTIGNIPVSEAVYGGPVLIDKDGNEHPLPERKDDTIYLVSSIAARAIAESAPSRDFKRDDFYIPSESVRDGEGRIIGCKSLERI